MISSEAPDSRVRSLEARDVLDVDALARRCGLSVDAAAELGRGHALVLVLEEAESVVGFALGWVVADELEILDVAVEERARGRGHGAWLLSALLERASGRGAARAFLEVRASNGQAIRLYERAGFSRVGERRGYYADGEDAWLFARGLEGATP